MDNNDQTHNIELRNSQMIKNKCVVLVYSTYVVFELYRAMGRCNRCFYWNTESRTKVEKNIVYIWQAMSNLK